MLLRVILALMYLRRRSFASALICRRTEPYHRLVSLKSNGRSIRRRSSARTPSRLPLSTTSLKSSMKKQEPFSESGERRDERGGPITGAPGSLERLCSVSLRSCHLMTPLIAAIYQQLLASSNNHNKRDQKTSESSTEKEGNHSVKKLKSDNSAFTIADGLVQRLLIEVLFSRVAFRDIVGEEEEAGDHGREGARTAADEEGWFQIEGLTIPQELRPLLISIRSEMDSLAATCLSPESSDGERHNYRHVTVFIDPIDGTKEFSSGKGEQCSVCIGFADEHGRAVGGVIYRPLSRPKPTWVAGARSEGFAICEFGEEEPIGVVPSKGGIADGAVDVNTDNMAGGNLLTTNGSISRFVESLNAELDFERVKSGGAGNKMMMLLENSIHSSHGHMLYIQDRGVSRWDSCAAEACLESFGGKLMKLTHLMETQDDTREGEKQSDNSEFYTYLASPNNLDFIPGRANLTKYNCRTALTTTIDPRHRQKALHVDQVKPYSNLCGLVALGKEWNTKERILYIKEAMARVATRNPPSFD